MHLNEIRRRIDALRNKLALELAVIELHRLVCEFALKWGIALAGDQPVPEPHTFPSKVAATGVKLTSHMGAVKYLEECRSKNTAPEAQKLLYRLLPCARDFPGPACRRQHQWGLLPCARDFPYNSLLALDA